MQIVLITIHLLLTLGMIGLVLIQKAEGSGLAGLSGSSGGSGGGFLSARGTANLLTHTTAILAALFMGTSLFLNILVSRDVKKSILAEPSAITKPQQADVKPVAPRSTPLNNNNIVHQPEEEPHAPQNNDKKSP